MEEGFIEQINEFILGIIGIITYLCDNLLIFLVLLIIIVLLLFMIIYFVKYVWENVNIFETTLKFNMICMFLSFLMIMGILQKSVQYENKFVFLLLYITSYGFLMFLLRKKGFIILYNSFPFIIFIFLGLLFASLHSIDWFHPIYWFVFLLFPFISVFIERQQEFQLSDDFNFEKILNKEYNIFDLRNKKEKESGFISIDIGNKLLIKNKKCYNQFNENNMSLLILPPKNKQYILQTNLGELILLVYKKEGNFYSKHIFLKTDKFENLPDNCQNFDFFSNISSLLNHFYLNSNMLSFCREINDNKYKNIFFEGEHGSGKTEILKRYLDGRKAFVSVERDNLYATPIVIIYDKVKDNLGIIKTLLIKFLCSFRLNIIPLFGSISILIALHSLEIFNFLPTIDQLVGDNNILSFFKNPIVLSVCLFTLIYFIISFLYYDIVVHIKQTSKINRSEFIKFINVASKKFKLSIIIEDLDRINDDQDWKCEIINLINSLKYGRIIVSYTNRVNKGKEVFDEEEIKKHFDTHVKYGNQIYLYCNLLYKKYHDLDLIHINSFRELKNKLNGNSVEKKENFNNPNYLLFQIINSEESKMIDLFNKSDFLKYSVEQLVSTKNAEIEYDVIVYLSILFLDKYNRSMEFVQGYDENKFNNSIERLLLEIKKYYYVNQIGQIDEEKFIEVFKNNLSQYASGMGII